MSRPDDPVSLLGEGGRAGSYIEAANRALEPNRSAEAQAWARLESRRARSRRSGLLALVTAAGAVAIVVAVAAPWLSSRLRRAPAPAEVAHRIAVPPAASPSPVVAPLPAPPSSLPAPSPSPSDGAPIEALAIAGAAVAPSALHPGSTVIGAGVRTRLSPRGVARVFPASSPGPARIALEQGRLDVDGRAPGPLRVEVSAASLRFDAEGSRFRVSVDGDKVALQVSGGRVLVWSSRRLVARVVAGQRWSKSAPALAPVVAPPGEKPEPQRAAGATPGRGCLDLARAGRVDQALACYGEEAARPGLDGELALIEIARIRRDVKGDLGGAERALAEHRRRFPTGALAAEVAVSHVELLLRLGRGADALAEASRLRGAEAAYYRGLALGKLGRKGEARRALDEYLGGADGEHRAEAERRRAELGP